MEKEIQIEKELENKRKLSKEVKDYINKKVFTNLAFSILYMMLMIAINILYLNIDLSEFITGVKLFSVLSIVVTIAVFEFAYRKESVEIMFYAIELLAFSIIVMYIPYIYIYLEDKIRQIFMLTPVFFAIYYVAKSIFITIKFSLNYKNNISDVKEIVKDEEDSSYLDEESTKIIKEVNAIEAAKKEEKKIIREAKKKQKQEVENSDVNKSNLATTLKPNTTSKRKTNTRHKSNMNSNIEVKSKDKNKTNINKKSIKEDITSSKPAKTKVEVSKKQADKSEKQTKIEANNKSKKLNKENSKNKTTSKANKE